MTGITGKVWKDLEMSGHVQNWLEMYGNDDENDNDNDDDDEEEESNGMAL